MTLLLLAGADFCAQPRHVTLSLSKGTLSPYPPAFAEATAWQAGLRHLVLPPGLGPGHAFPETGPYMTFLFPHQVRDRLTHLPLTSSRPVLTGTPLSLAIG